MQKKIFLLWLQGWINAPWLQKKVLESWQINNPTWNIELIDFKNLENYVDDINYIYDKKKKISFQAKSDIIRLSLLKNYGGVWADSTLLCMQPLDHWVFEAIKKSGIWMYHGHGYNLRSDLGPASWFIISEKEGYLISKWKKECDLFWSKNNKSIHYFWMDGLFKKLLDEDSKFKSQWVKTPYLYCEKIGSSHTLADYNFGMESDIKQVKEIFKNNPPYALKLSSNWEKIFPNLKDKRFINSNANNALLLSKRRYIFKHNYEQPVSRAPKIKKISYLLRYINKIIHIFKMKIIFIVKIIKDSKKLYFRSK